MRYLTHFIIFCLFISMFALSGCSAGSRAFTKAEQFEADGNYEDAMYSYAEAFRKDPDAGEYRVRFFKARDKASEKRYKMGMALLDRGDYVGALENLQTAYGLDPTQDQYKQQIEVATRLKDAQQAYTEGLDFEKTNKLMDANRSYLAALELNPDNKEYKAALARISGQQKSKLEGFELSLKSSKPITLKFKDARIKDVFTIITQLTGINFIFDEGVKDQTISIYLENATFQQTLDILTNMHKLHTKILNESTILVYPKTPEKSKQYDDLILRTFHLSYMDAKKGVNLVRTMLQVKKIYVNEETNSIIVRDTGDVVDVVGKILEANDVPDPEVVLDVEVMEVTDHNAENLGLLLSNYNVQLGAFSPNNNLLSASSLAPTTTTTTTGTTTGTVTDVTVDNLVKAFALHGYSGFVTVPTAQYNFGKTLTKGEVLSNPKIRVKNKEKAKFNVGQRVPITTTTLNGTLSQVNVQYVDVGVKVNAEPTIQLNNEVVIKLSLEVSSILSKEIVGGSSSPTSVVTIGTRNLDTVLSLKDGETSVIGGLIQNTKNNTKQKIFLLSDIPLIGPFLTNHDSSKDKTELILAITPHLVRSVTVPGNNLMSFNSGKEDDPSLTKSMASFDQEPVFETTPKVGTGKPAHVMPGQVNPVPTASPVLAKPAPAIVSSAIVVPTKPMNEVLPKATVPSPVPAPQTGNVAPVGQAAQAAQAVAPTPTTVVTPPQPVAILPLPAKPAPVQAKRGLAQIAAPVGAGVGQTFYVDIKAGDVQDLAAAPFVMTYDPAVVDFIKATEGTFLNHDGKPTLFSVTPDVKGGTLTVKLERAPKSGGVSGYGTLASALFGAKSKGTAHFGFRSLNFTAADGKPLEILPFSTTVDVH
ncbi:MAG: cohesin domain-containing protein [Geobacteraceae bacterium]|nr:cohesin domain-containing protein [Geobacteraceae bacterium]